MSGKSTFGILQIVNRTHLLWHETMADKYQRPIDYFYLTQTQHGPFKLPSTGGGPRATTVILAIVIVILVVAICAFLYMRLQAFMRRRRAQQKMSYVNLQEGSLEL